MNNINFIKKIVPQQQLQFYKWFKISVICLGTFFGCALVINFQQFYKISKLKKLKIQKENQLVDFEEVMKNKNNLKTKLESIEKGIEKIEDAKILNKKIVNYLEQISDSMPNETCLRNLSYDSNGSFDLKGVSIDPNLVSIFIKNISKLPFFKEVKLVYLKMLTDQNVENSEEPNLEFLIKVKLNNSKF